MSRGEVNVVLGLQRGDEGKGRIVDLFAADHDTVARFNGGNNAGHTIDYAGEVYKLHQVPCGILYEGTLNIIGNGVLLNPSALRQEAVELANQGATIDETNLAISSAAQLVLPHHIKLDEMRETSQGRQGSTQRGIAFAASDKYIRSNVRAEVADQPDKLRQAVVDGLLRVNQIRREASLEEIDETNIEVEAARWAEGAAFIRPYLADSVALIRDRLQTGSQVLAEGAQSCTLDIEHGMYPYVTSSHTTIGGVLNGLGVNHNYLGKVVGVMKGVKSHVGDGPFVTEIKDEVLAEQVRGPRGQADSEYGTSTGRPRRVGYLDLPELRRAIWLNGVDELALTKLDHLTRFGRSLPIAVAYEKDGQRLEEAPGSAEQLAGCQPVLQEIPLWSSDKIRGARRFGDLPVTARRLVKFIQDELDTPITIIGTGPGRGDIISVRR